MGNNACDGMEDITSYCYGWSSTNTGVATVDVYGNVTGVAVGTATIECYVSVEGTKPPSCDNRIFSPQEPMTVQVPYKVSYISTQSQGRAVCGAGMAGWTRNVTLQLQSQASQPITIAGLTMADTINIVQPNPLGVTKAQTGSYPTNSSGEWPDTYYVCSTACPGSTGEADEAQFWTYDGIALPEYNSIVLKCGSITIDGH